MKRINMIGLGAIALIATTTFSGVMPGLATLQSRDTAYIQQVFWAKKYLPRKSEGFRDPILNSKFFVEN